MRMLIGAAALAATFVLTPAYAVDFPATPLNHGAPTNLPGEDIIPGLREALVAVNGVTQPLLQPILAPGGAVPDQAIGPGRGGLRRHHHHRALAHLRRHHRVVARLRHHHAATRHV